MNIKRAIVRTFICLLRTFMFKSLDCITKDNRNLLNWKRCVREYVAIDLFISLSLNSKEKKQDDEELQRSLSGEARN
jgi:hypothetical protein